MRSIGRYLLFGEIAAGGMATVHLGRMSGAAGFSRTVAIKRLHPAFAKDAEFVAMFLDEARLAARIRHPNVIPTLDVVATEDEVFLVMEYVQGESLARLRRATANLGKPTDARIVAAIMSGVLHGLHAAHEATDEQGNVLGIVHRDVSPQNILVGVDGTARLLDFGVAKAMGRAQTTQDGQVKGKLAYMPPEQLNGGVITRRTDIYSAAVVTWEALTGQRLFHGDHQAAVITAVFQKTVSPPSAVAPHVSPAFDRVVMRGLEREPALRYATAREMAMDLERCLGVASTSEVGTWVESLAGTELSKRTALVSDVESASAPDASLQSWRPRDGYIATPPESNVSSPPWAASQLSAAIFVPGRFRPRMAVAVWIAMGGISVLLALLLSARKARAPERTPPPTSAAVTQSSEDDPARVPVTAPPPIAGDVSVAASTPDPESTPPPADTPDTAPARVTVMHARARSRATRSECDPPFSIDDKGHKHYKATCLP